MTPAEYMAVDSQLPTSDSHSDGQIIEMVASSNQSIRQAVMKMRKERKRAPVWRRSAYHPAQWLMQLTR